MLLEDFKVERLPEPALGMMHYWDGAHLAPGARITCPVHLAACSHVGDILGHTSPHSPAPGVMKGIGGNGTHARHRPQRHQTGACVFCKLWFRVWVRVKKRSRLFVCFLGGCCTNAFSQHTKVVDHLLRRIAAVIEHDYAIKSELLCASCD